MSSAHHGAEDELRTHTGAITRVHCLRIGWRSVAGVSVRAIFICVRLVFIWVRPTFIWVRPTFVCVRLVFIWVRPTFVWVRPTFVWVRPTFIWVRPTFIWVRFVLYCNVFRRILFFNFDVCEATCVGICAKIQ